MRPTALLPKVMLSVFLISILCSAGPAFAVPSTFVQVRIATGEEPPAPEYDNYSFLGGDAVYGEHFFDGLGTLSGSAFANPQQVGVKVTTPSVPLDWALRGQAMATALYSDSFYYGGTGTGTITYHYDVTGSVTNPVVDSWPDYNRMAVYLDVRVEDVTHHETIYYHGRYNGSQTTINESFDVTLPFEFGSWNMTYGKLTAASDVWPGHPAQTVNFYETASYYVKELKDAQGARLPLAEMSVLSGHDYSVPIQSAPIPEPTTILLLGSGLVGLAGFRRKSRK